MCHCYISTMAAPIRKPAYLRIFENEEKTASEACNFIVELANSAIKDRDVFTIGLSGGSAAKFLCRGLPELDTDWSKWKVFFCDERHVPFDDPECTYSVYKRDLMSQVSLPEENIFPDNPSLTVEDAAKEYASKLGSVFGCDCVPQFDLLLLGMGPDGHTCSLFPGHKLLEETSVWVAPITDSPKPPTQRITLTLPVIQNARCAMFISCGESKADMLQRVLEGNETPALPAARVNPHSGDLFWFLDKAAAQNLTNIEAQL